MALPSADACAELLRCFPKLCWVAVNASAAGEGKAELLSVAQQQQPDLPILWLDPERTVDSSNTSVLRVSTLPPPSELAELVDEALQGQFYGVGLVSALRDSADLCLNTLGAYSMLRKPFLRANRAPLAELNAILPFVGATAAGYLLVGCSEVAAHHAAAQVFATPEGAIRPDQAADVMGELASRVLGHLMAQFDARGTPVTFGMPLYIGASAAVLWESQGAPCLGVEFEGGRGSLLMELSVTERQTQRVAPEVLPTDMMEWGSCILL
jgi:hypothetical protein